MAKTFRYSLILLTIALGVSLDAQRGQWREAPGVSLWLSGTYELERTRGDNPRDAADAATRDLPRMQRDRAYQDLLSRLEPPSMIAIDRNGRSVTISSSSGPRVTFDVDGRSRDERFDRRSMSTRAEFLGDRLQVTTRATRSTDFVVTFEPLDRGDGLLVTRQMDSDDLRRPVTIRSYYRRVSRDARWDLYRGAAVRRDFLVPDGTRLVAVLDTAIYSERMRGGERFSMTVQSPAEFRGARIEGVVGRVQTYGSARNAEVRLYFDRIHFRDRDADFEGVLSGVRMSGGARLRVDAAHDDADAGQNAVESGAIGAALGAIIGAIAGGGKGAAVGAMIGGIGGVIAAEDRNTYVDLPPGTEITIVTTGRIR